MICRRVVMVIENDSIGDKLWSPGFVMSLREYAQHSERTTGAGLFPACYHSTTGDKITVYAGTYVREFLLERIPKPKPKRKRKPKRNPILYRIFNKKFKRK